MKKIRDNSLYLVISEECGRVRSAVEVAESAMAGGVDLIQMREKNKTKDELVALGRELSHRCRNKGVKFIVNDDPFTAAETNADGVHLGQEDMRTFSISRAREILGIDRIIGVSTHSLGEFKKANEDDVDYIAYGPVFPTKTKDYFIGTKDVAGVMKIATRPVFFIGGINLSNIDTLINLGARNIAMIRGITEADDILSAAKAFRDKLDTLKGDKSGRYITDRR